MAAKAAMEYAVELEDGLEFLRLWQSDNWESIQQRWPDAPQMIYVSKKLIL
jgi:hypothetical protein